MSRKDHVSETPATAFLKRHGVAFTEHVYEYEEHGGTRCRRASSASTSTAS